MNLETRAPWRGFLVFQVVAFRAIGASSDLRAPGGGRRLEALAPPPVSGLAPFLGRHREDSEEPRLVLLSLLVSHHAARSGCVGLLTILGLLCVKFIAYLRRLMMA